MSRRVLALSALALVAAPAVAAPAAPPSLGTKPFTLTADKRAKHPNVAVDAQGVGHFAWDVAVRGGDDPLVSCRVPRGKRACAATQTFALPLESFGEPQVLAPGNGMVVLIANRCCGAGEGTYAIVSTDGGATWGAPAVTGTVEPGQAVFWPGKATILLTDDVITGGIRVQAAPLTDPGATTSANVGDGPSQGYDGSIGLPANQQPVVAFDDLTTTFWRQWSGSGDVNVLDSWGPKHTLGKLTEVRFAGATLIGKRTLKHPFRTQYVARTFKVTGDGFGPALAVSPGNEHDVIFMDAFQDAGGNRAVTWVANGRHGKHSDPIRYRADPAGAAYWNPVRTLVGSTSDEAFDLQLGAAPDGGGFVTYDRNSKGPLRAVAIPKLSAQR